MDRVDPRLAISFFALIISRPSLPDRLALTGLQDGYSSTEHQIVNQQYLKARREKVIPFFLFIFKDKQNFPQCLSLIRIVTYPFLNQSLTRDKESPLLAQWFLVLLYQNDLENLLKHRLLGSTPQFQQFLQCGLRICLPHKFLGDADAAGLRNGEVGLVSLKVHSHIKSRSEVGNCLFLSQPTSVIFLVGVTH